MESVGIHEWAPTHAHPDQIAFREDALAENHESPPPSLDEIRHRLGEGVSPHFGEAYETESRRELHNKIAMLRAQLAAQAPEHGGIGHNYPPADMALTEDLSTDLNEALATADTEVERGEPNAFEIVKTAGVFERP